MTPTLFESSIPSLPLLGRGKVRDIYAVGDDKLLVIVSDRLSAFDVILPDPIPDKGRVLTAMAAFWFGKLAHVIPSQLTGIDPETVVATEAEREQVRGRSMVVKRLKPLPIEAVAQEGAESYVFEMNDGHFDRRAVHVEYRDQESAVIANDGVLRLDATVAITNAHQMQVALKNKSGGGVDPHAGHNH